MSTTGEALIIEQLWSSIFKIGDLGPESDFFAMGGESIQAMEMILKLERKTGKQIPIGTLYSATTLAQFTEATARIESDDKTPIVTSLNEQGEGRPLFLIAPAIGGVFHYKNFWQHVGERSRTYCIEPRISVQGEHSYSSVEEVASCLVEEMRRIQKVGPYRLCGYSFGGSLAWEMARQLDNQQQNIECLIVMDSMVRGIEQSQRQEKRGLGYWLKRLRRAHRDHRANGQWLHLPWIFRLVLIKIANSISVRPAKTHAGDLPEGEQTVEIENRVQEVLRANYNYGSYPDELILLRARYQLTLHRQLDYDLGWRGRAKGGLRIISIPGHHLNMMKPPASVEIAKVVGGLLDELEETAPVPDAGEDLARPSVEFPPESVGTVLEQFYRVLDTLADHSAIFDEGERVSFRQLNHRANVIAEALSDQAPSGSGIYVFLPTTHWTVAAFLGAFKAGYYYVPVDPAHPDVRIRLIVEDAKCSCILTSRELSHRVGDIFTEIASDAVYIEDLDFSGERPDQENPTNPDDIGTILYTSGSTGNPKGVVHTQKSISSVAWRRGAGISLSSKDRYMQIYSGAFMGALNGIYGSLLYGSCLYFYNLKNKGISELGPWLQVHRITVFHAVTSIYRQFIGTVGTASTFPSIRCVTPGGEPSRISDIRQFKEVFERGTIYYANLGSSECGSIAFDPIRHDTEIHPDIPVGVPFGSLEVFILDGHGNPNSPGVEGEIAVCSDSIFKEYWNDPQKTEAALKWQPDGRTIYHTGDYGYITEDGKLVNKGRQDGQVKINGYRVEIPEVESAILSLEAVRETAVVAREDKDGNLRLVAFIRPEKEGAQPASVISAQLLELLPRPMVPTQFFLVSHFPLKDNGKLDRQLLSRMPVEEMKFVIG